MQRTFNECAVVCNGPSVQKIINERNLGFNLSTKYLIAVNRWLNVFNTLQLPNPHAVVVGAQSMPQNKPLFGIFPQIDFYLHSDENAKHYANFRNVKCTPKGNQDIEGHAIYFDASLWWTGVYQIQLALSLGFERIHIFGFTCTDEPDYADSFKRAPIPSDCQTRIEHFFHTLVSTGLDKRIFIYEESPSWRFNSSIGHRRTSFDQLVIEKLYESRVEMHREAQITAPAPARKPEKLI